MGSGVGGTITKILPTMGMTAPEETRLKPSIDPKP